MREKNIKHSTNSQRTQDTYGHILLWIFCFLRRGANGIETNKGKEYHARRTEDFRGYLHNDDQHPVHR